MENKSKHRRHIRTSRLDYGCGESSINNSEFRGFLNLFNLSIGMFLISDPILRYFETGRFVDHSLAEEMFEDVFLILFNWLQCFLWSFTAFFGYHLFASGYISRPVLRIIQHTTQTITLGYSVALCLYQDWPILPCGFTLAVAMIMFMKMHSFTESLLEMHDIKNRVRQTLSAKSRNESPKPESTEAESLNGRESKDEDDFGNGSKSTLYGTDEIKEMEKEKETVEEKDETKLSAAYAIDRQIDQLRKRHVTHNEMKSDDEVLEDILENDLGTSPSFRFFVYYLVCPILVYESHYPKGQPFRPIYFFKKLLAMTTAMVALYLISTRYLIPAFHSTINHSFLFTLVILLFPMLFCYLLVFFILFECICNLLAEITNFGDREFYHDWWNSTTMDEFSRKWNRPVHEFLLRHVYYKSVYRFRLSKNQATAATFFFSALLHELVMAVCFKVVRLWMFTLMMLQLPLIKGTELGNYIFWASMAVGIPLLSIAYGREYIKCHQDQMMS